MSLRNFLIIVLSATLIVIFAILALLKKDTFIWYPTFDNADKQPYGCMVFDSVMSASYKPGYEVSDLSADSLSIKAEYKKHTILIVKEEVDLELDSMMKFVKEGGSLIVCTNSLSEKISENWRARISQYYYYGKHPAKGLFMYVKYPKDDVYPGRNYMVSVPIGNYMFEAIDSVGRDTMEDDTINSLNWKDKVLLGGLEGYSMAKVSKYGKGILVICSMPLLFTNYGILENDNYNLVMRIVAQAGKKPIVRTRNTITETKNEGNGDTPPEVDKSYLQHILSDTPLKTAFYLSLIGFLLFIIFTAKRKQRVVPVIKEKKNGQLKFIQQIGSLYKRNNDTDVIISSKYRLLAENIKRKVGVDITDPTDYQTVIQRIEAQTGINGQEIESTLQQLNLHFQSIEKVKALIFETIRKDAEKNNWHPDLINFMIESRTRKTPKATMVQLIDLMNAIDHKL